MEGTKSTRIVDASESQLQSQMVKAGIWLTFAVCTAAFAYVAATWEQPNRSLIMVMFGGGIVAALVIAALPIERILRSTFVSAFFVTWSLLDIALIAVAVAADGGSTSPFSFLFFLPMVFAAVFYPLRTFVPVAAADVLGYLIAAELYGHPEPVYVTFAAVSLTFAAVLCAWQAQNHDRARDQLTRMSRTDPLTDSLNRRGFEERVHGELDDALRSGRPVGLVLLDLDNFKSVNDLHGHAAGDELLCWVVEEWTAQFTARLDRSCWPNAGSWADARPAMPRQRQVSTCRQSGCFMR